MAQDRPGQRFGCRPDPTFPGCPYAADQILSRPFRANSYKSPSIPRALPWAFLSGPFRAGKARRSATNRVEWRTAKSGEQEQLCAAPASPSQRRASEIVSNEVSRPLFISRIYNLIFTI